MYPDDPYHACEEVGFCGAIEQGDLRVPLSNLNTNKKDLIPNRVLIAIIHSGESPTLFWASFNNYYTLSVIVGCTLPP
jgi:hypothetical protein